MEGFDEQALEVIERAAEYFGTETLALFIKSLKRQKLVNTRQLLNSLSTAQKTDLGKVVHSVTFAFEEYGRFLDIKNKRWSQQPPIEEILKWVEEKGLDSFGEDPNPYKRSIKTPERRKNEIAWGIARQRVIRRGPQKGRSWYRKNFFKTLNALQEELLLGISERTVEQMRETLLWRLKRGASGKYF